MKICFLSEGHMSLQVLDGDTSKSGGAEAQVAYLAQDFARMGDHVDLIYGDGSHRADPQLHAGVYCIDAYPAWSKPRSLYSFWSALKQFDFITAFC